MTGRSCSTLLSPSGGGYKRTISSIGWGNLADDSLNAELILMRVSHVENVEARLKDRKCTKAFKIDYCRLDAIVPRRWPKPPTVPVRIVNLTETRIRVEHWEQSSANAHSWPACAVDMSISSLKCSCASFPPQEIQGPKWCMVASSSRQSFQLESGQG